MAIFVESHKAGHGNRGHFEAEEEEEEMACAHHHVHSEQCGEGQHIEFAFLKAGIGTVKPLAGLNEDDECTERQYRLDYAYSMVGSVHSAESSGCLRRKNVDQYMYQHQRTDERVEPFARFRLGRFGSCKQVSNEDNHQ